MSNVETIFAERTRRMGVSVIREMLKVVSHPGMVSLAGGIPAPESFAVDLMRQLAERVLTKYGAKALQYDATEGFEPLREVLAAYLYEMGIEATPEGILVTSGSQSVLNALGMILISKGDTVVVEGPTYLGALQAFTPYEPEFLCVDTDEGGIIPHALEEILKRRTVKFIYLVPTFQNPTGRTICADRRRAVADLIQRYNTILIEDDPYSALRYDGESVPSIKSMAPAHVIYAGSLSKIFAPGLRIGYCVAPEPIRKQMVTAKQGIDLHSSTFDQALASEYIGGGYLSMHLPNIVSLYRPRLAAMLAALARNLPSGFSWSRPQGGMFIWLKGPAGLNMEEIYHRAVARNVAFVPGRFFFVNDDQGIETARLNFTMSNEGILEKAVKTLADVIEIRINGTADKYCRACGF